MSWLNDYPYYHIIYYTLLPHKYKYKSMLSTVEVPHLKPGQKIKDYKRLFKAATVGYKDADKLGCLAVYIHRTDGEKELAYQASEKESLDAAFTFLEELIDGPPCEFLESEEFFKLNPKGPSVDAIRSYFFELYGVSKSAKIPTDVFLKRFLSNVSGGKKLYDSNKEAIKTGLSDDEIVTVFKSIMEKLRKRTEEEVKEAKEESFVFSYDQSTKVSEAVPQWAKNIQEELSDLRVRVVSSESGFEEQCTDGDSSCCFSHSFR
jgi:hypothetical protein